MKLIELYLPPLAEIELEIERRECARSFAGFVKRAWHVLEPAAELKWGWSLDAICEHLEAVHRGDILSLLMNVPPGCMKSLLTGVLFPAWEWGPAKRPDLRYLGTSHKQDLAVRDNMKCRRLIKSDWYQSRWPVTLTGDQNAKTKFENDATGFREAMAFTSMTGSRGDRIILDDPLSVDDANSDAALLAAELTFTEALPTRLNNEKSAKIVIMQRLHDRDPSGIILAKGLDYVHLCLPMEFEPARRCHTVIGFSDPRTDEDELLFPERFAREQVDDLKKTMGSYAVAGQFQQRPAPRSGGMFQRGDFEIVEAVPAGARRCRAWDFAASKETPGKQPDWTVGLRMAYAKGTFYVETVTRGRWSPSVVEQNLKNTASQDGGTVTIRMPQDPGAAGKSDAENKVKLLAGYPVKVSTVTGDKATRARPASAQAEAGNVKLIRGDWNTAFLDEVCAFPSAQFDDQVDAFADALNELALGSSFSFDNF
ncbi:phage terminase large subunit [Rhizobium sp. RCC_161_2]|uniref:phage terminase large subunit n=1 Tax=Rhizobium sp. RCC_161_2 TaxID=3239219 RepID=UPI00352556AB